MLTMKRISLLTALILSGALLAQATKIAMDDAAILPLYWQKLYWAGRIGFVVDADRGEATSVHFIHRAP